MDVVHPLRGDGAVKTSPNRSRGRIAGHPQSLGFKDDLWQHCVVIPQWHLSTQELRWYHNPIRLTARLLLVKVAESSGRVLMKVPYSMILHTSSW